MNPEPLGHHLTEAHIEALAEKAALAHLDSGALYNRRRTFLARRERVLAFMAAHGIRETKRRNFLGCDQGMAARLKVALRKIRDAIGHLDTAIQWNKMDRQPCVLTDFRDRSSATTINFGY